MKRLYPVVIAWFAIAQGACQSRDTSRRGYDVAREADRVRISAGTGKSREIWSFVPPDSAAAWTESIRVVIKA